MQRFFDHSSFRCCGVGLTSPGRPIQLVAPSPRHVVNQPMYSPPYSSQQSSAGAWVTWTARKSASGIVMVHRVALHVRILVPALGTPGRAPARVHRRKPGHLAGVLAVPGVVQVGGRIEQIGRVAGASEHGSASRNSPYGYSHLCSPRPSPRRSPTGRRLQQLPREVRFLVFDRSNTTFMSDHDGHTTQTHALPLRPVHVHLRRAPAMRAPGTPAGPMGLEVRLGSVQALHRLHHAVLLVVAHRQRRHRRQVPVGIIAGPAAHNPVGRRVVVLVGRERRPLGSHLRSQVAEAVVAEALPPVVPVVCARVSRPSESYSYCTTSPLIASVIWVIRPSSAVEENV